MASSKKERLGKLMHNNKLYYYKSKSNASEYYKCVESTCSGRLIKSIATGEFLESKGHSCLISKVECQIDSARKELKKSALSSKEPPSKVIMRMCREFSPSVMQSFPRSDNLYRNVRRWRQPEGISEPKTLAEVKLTDHQKVVNIDNKEEEFLYRDSMDDSRILVFATEKNIQQLSKARIWCMDGTFDVVSCIYTQLFSIHGITDDGWTLPLCYALLPNKASSSYNFVLTALRDNQYGYHLNPKIIILDFEKGMINSAADIFPAATLQGCHFHLTQSLIRNLSKYSSLRQMYDDNPEFSLFIRKLFGLAFVPLEDIYEAFEKLQNTAQKWHQHDIDKFLDYFRRTYMRSVGSSYPPSFWSVHQRVKENDPRTNNSVESWNRRIQIMAESSHLPLYRLIELLQGEQVHTSFLLAQRLAGEPLKDKRYRQKELNRRIYHLVTTYKTENMDEFMLGIAFNMTQIRTFRNKRKLNMEVESTNDTPEIQQTSTKPGTRVQTSKRRKRETIEEQATQEILPHGFAEQFSTAPVKATRKRRNYNIGTVRRSARNAK